jgi:hypothetical protein
MEHILQMYTLHICHETTQVAPHVMWFCLGMKMLNINALVEGNKNQGG